MIKNYLQVAFKMIIKNKSFVIINTLGLGVSLACCIAAYLIIAYNLEFDNFHKDEKVGVVYKIHTRIKEKDETKNQSISAPMPLGPLAAEEISGIESYARFIGGFGYMRHEDKAFAQYISFTDSTFFDMFDFPLIAGNHKSFKNKNSVFISQKIATKYFGKEDPLGKIFVLNFNDNIIVEAIVGGVIDRVPSNSSFVFDVLMRIETFLYISNLTVDNWGDNREPTTFLKLISAGNSMSVSKQLNKYVAKRNEAKRDVIVESYTLEPFKAVFSYGKIRSGYVNLRDKQSNLVIWSSMALLILLIACFNLTNTSVAMTAKRLKEVGVRKAIGASRAQIVTQFLFETFIILLLSLLIGMIIAQFMVPTFTNMWEFDYGLNDLDGVNMFIALVILVFIASMLAGVYPALYSSKLNPVVLLKGNVKMKGTNNLMRVFLIIQFVLSVLVLVAGVMFIRNAKFQGQLKFGYDKDMLINVIIPTDKEFALMENEITKNSKILNVAATEHHVYYDDVYKPIKIDTSNYEVKFVGVGKNFLQSMGFTLLEGRLFDVSNASDFEQAVIVNRAFIEKTGIKDPLDKAITINEKKRYIVGVIENYVHDFWHIKEDAQVIYPALPSAYHYLVVKVKKSDRIEMKKYLEETWKKLFPSIPSQIELHEDMVFKYAKRSNQNMETIFLFLTIIGGLLSASGIFALASLNIAKRTKEIGIRKSLGASISNIVNLLNKEFLIVLSIAALLGSVGGFYLTDFLLTNYFTIHIDITIIPIILCALVIFAIGIITTTITIQLAARANPVDTLRDE